VGVIAKDQSRRVLFYRFSAAEMSLLLLGFAVIGATIMFSPYLHSLTLWSLHRTTGFEGKQISLPKRWILAERGHLLNLRQPSLTLLFPYESTITVDPFGNKWPSSKLAQVSALWLSAHGSAADVKFAKQLGGDPLGFGRGARCVSSSPQDEQRYVSIYCLSEDSSLSLEFFGKLSAVGDFAEISSQILSDPSSNR
jgi:hypothetical protein